MINLDEHKVYIDQLKMEMVPLSIALQAVHQASQSNLENAVKVLDSTIEGLKGTIKDLEE